MPRGVQDLWRKNDWEKSGVKDFLGQGNEYVRALHLNEAGSKACSIGLQKIQMRSSSR